MESRCVTLKDIQKNYKKLNETFSNEKTLADDV